MRLFRPVFVGRHEERRVIEQCIDAAREGHGRAMVLEGLAGSGKSRLVEYAQAEASRRGFMNLLGMAGEGQERTPYGLLLDAFRRCIRATPGALPGWLDPRSAWTDLVTFRPAAALQGPQHAFHEISQALKRRGAPVLLVVEDLHWADRASLDILDWLIRELGQSSLFLLGTCRSEALKGESERIGLIHRLGRRAGVIHARVAGLSPTDTRELVDATLGPTADPGFLARQLHRRTSGNPLFLEELLRRIVSDGVGPDAPLPLSFRDAVRSRLLGLRREDLRLLQLASVIGDAFDAETLKYLSRRTGSDLDKALVRMGEQQLIRPSPERGGFQFWHALTREVLYEQLLLPDRRALHRRIAQRWLATPGGAAADQSPDIAYQLEKAGEEADAARHYAVAAERAAALCAFDEAFAHGERAWAFAVEDRGQQALQASRYARMAGRIGAALEYCGKAEEFLADSGTPRLRAEVRLHESDLHWLKGDGRRATELLQAVHEMHRGDDGTDAPVWAWLLARQAQRACLESRWSDALAPADAAIAMSRRLQLPVVEAHVLVTSGMAEAALRGFERGLATLQRGRALAEQHGSVEDICRSYVVEVDLHIRAADLAAGSRVAVEGTERARRMGAPVVLYPTLAVTALELLWKTGQWQEALDRLPETERLVNEQPSDLVRCHYGAVLASIATDRDRLEEATRCLAEADALARTMHESQWVLPLYVARTALALAQQRPEEARRVALEALERFSPRDAMETGEMAAAGLQADCMLQHSRRRANKTSRVLVAPDVATEGAHGADYYLHLTAGFRALLSEKYTIAARDFRAAAARAVGMPSPVAEARSREWLAVALQKQGGAAAKQESVRQRTRARAILAGIPGRHGETGSPLEVLSEREREVARLAADGLANKLIGARLSISERTVAVHLSRIFQKVGVDSRHRLMALVAGPSHK